ncbi:hypothetical protein H0H87_006802 [Tephrocybe sp. NHM501043]|nr:hypothetical protein H0H87_006802 [Tephrocybe sp. NHM501043]
MAPPPEKPPIQNTFTVPQYLWDKDPDLDDALHNPDINGRDDNSVTVFSARGWANAGALVVLVVALITLFAGYPVIWYYTRNRPKISGFNLGGINSTGQIPDLPGLQKLIDPDTPDSALSRVGSDGKKYNLVFSDEFNIDGRTFFPGDDAFWEAAITTEGGKMVITLTEETYKDLNFKSGESHAHAHNDEGLKGRAGYGATTEGMWPYSYDTCDLGTFPNQTATDGTPEVVATGAPGGGPLSFLPGQRLSACTCPGSDHPGPKVSNGRGVPEIDILEAQVDESVFRGQVSQSFQCAPFNYQYEFNNATPATTILDSSITKLNTYKGATFQQAVSAVSYVDSANYDGQGYSTYGYEWYFDQNRRQDGYIAWYSGGAETWSITSDSIGPDPISNISARLIPEEPMVGFPPSI